MLILTRKTGTTLIVGNLGDKTTITILEVKGNHVRIGIDAPPHIEVDRGEIRVKKDKERSDGEG